MKMSGHARSHRKGQLMPDIKQKKPKEVWSMNLVMLCDIIITTEDKTVYPQYEAQIWSGVWVCF